ATVKVHGVFLSCRGKSESSPILLFRRAYGRDSSQVVTPFVQVGTYPTRNFATLGPLYVRPPFTGASVRSFALRLTSCLNLPAPGRRQCVYVGLDNALAHTCVFAKQSLGTILCGRSLLPLTGHILPAPLIPKLRGHFAEFLFRESLEPLRLLA